MEDQIDRKIRPVVSLTKSFEWMAERGLGDIVKRKNVTKSYERLEDEESYETSSSDTAHRRTTSETEN